MDKQSSLVDISNPLLAPQRERAGAQTFSKYMYQYHWALYRILEEHENGSEFAVFVELHEDVVVANSLDKAKAEFEFNQVKTDKNSFTIIGLTKPKKGKKSILGKLLENCLNKPYSESIKQINLVSTSGFSIAQKNKGLKLKVIKISDVTDDIVKQIQGKLKKEIAVDKLPDSLQFVIPDLPIEGFQKFLIGHISDLINKLFLSPSYNSSDIYRILLDEITRKGSIEYDYNRWDDLLRNKALTSTTVGTVIKKFTNCKNDSQVVSSFNEITNELGLKVIQKRKLREAFNRYYTNRLGDKSTSQLQVSRDIRKLISLYENQCEDMLELVRLVSEGLPNNIKQTMTNDAALQAAIICEFILQDHNE